MNLKKHCINLSKNKKLKMQAGLTGIILSGGKSSRMGREKGLCLLKEKPLIAFSIKALNNVCDSLIISANNRQYDSFGYPVVKDEIAGIGPAGGIYSCLKASGTDDNYIISSDTPMITPELIRHILSHKSNYDAVVPVVNGFTEPLCAFYRKSCIASFRESIFAGKYKIQDIIKGLNCNFIKIEPTEIFYHSHLFTNVNTLEDLTKLEKFLTKNRPDEG